MLVVGAEAAGKGRVGSAALAEVSAHMQDVRVKGEALPDRTGHYTRPVINYSGKECIKIHRYSICITG